MGFISTMTRRMRNNRLSRRLSTISTTGTTFHDEDSNLIKTISEPPSRGASMDSTSTFTQHSVPDPVLPSESPANRRQLDNMNMDGLFGDTHSDYTARTLARPGYPVLKLDMCQSSEPRRVLQGPLETEKTKNGKSKCSQKDWRADVGCFSSVEKGFMCREESVREKKRRKSVTGLLKRQCGLNRPSSVSRRRRSEISPKWFNYAGTEGECLVGVKNENWLETHLQPLEKRSNSLWGGLGRLW